MSRLRKLMEEFCPDGVEYKKLGEIAEIIRGNGLQKKDFVDQGIGCIHYGQIYTRYGAFADRTLTYVTPQLASTLKTVSTGDLVVAITSENVEDVCKCVAWLGENDIVTGGHTAIVKHKQNPKYLAYLFQTEDFFRQKRKYVVGTKVIEMSPRKLAEIIIPVPPIEIQNEIVKLLDNFTELTAELTLRKKQYNFYRDSLLNFVRVNDTIVQTDRQTDRQAQRISKFGLCRKEFKVEWKTLGEVATDIFRGAGIKRSDVTEEGVPCVRYGEIYTNYGIWFDKCRSYTNEQKITSPKYFEYGDILFAITGENIEEIAKSTAYMGFDRCLAGGDIVVLRHRQNPKYLSYVLSTEMAQKQKSKGKVKSKVVHSSIPSIKSITVPIPPLEIQDYVVSILDRFDALCNDLTNGLPAEIAARKEQYEHYRDKLLTFPRSNG